MQIRAHPVCHPGRCVPRQRRERPAQAQRARRRRRVVAPCSGARPPKGGRLPDVHVNLHHLLHQSPDVSGISLAQGTTSVPEAPAPPTKPQTLITPPPQHEDSHGDHDRLCFHHDRLRRLRLEQPRGLLHAQQPELFRRPALQTEHLQLVRSDVHRSTTQRVRM